MTKLSELLSDLNSLSTEQKEVCFLAIETLSYLNKENPTYLKENLNTEDYTLLISYFPKD